MSVLSISSRVARGYVGNSVAVPLLQALGNDVWAVDTVQFSNHPGHGEHTGAVLPPETVRQHLLGVLGLGGLGGCHAVMSGYLGHVETGPSVLDALIIVRTANAGAYFVCDPVLGDRAEGVYVDEGFVAFFRDQALPMADIALPNAFELELLSGKPVTDLPSAITAARLLMERGTKAVVVSSLEIQGDSLVTLAITAQGAWGVQTPKLARAAKGTGDMLAALVTGSVLVGKPLPEAVGDAVAGIYAILDMTAQDVLDLPLAQGMGAVFRSAGQLNPIPIPVD